ncbi:hypothetical protein [Rhizobium sp. PAMB 3182]
MAKTLEPKLANILSEEISPVQGRLGRGDPQQRTMALKERLFLEAGTSSRMMYAALAMILAVFVVMLYLLVLNAGNTTVLLAVSGASGLSISGLIWFAVRVAREAAQGALLVALASQLSSENALAAMKAILQQQQAIPPAGGATEPKRGKT